MNRVVTRSSITDVRNISQGLSQIRYWIGSVEIPAYVWVSMVLLAAAGLCYSLTQHTRNELLSVDLQYRKAVAQVEQIKIENERLKNELDAVEKDPRTIEALAREAGMVANDEAVVLLRPDYAPKPVVLKGIKATNQKKKR